MAKNNPATRRVYDQQYRAAHPELYRGITAKRRARTKEYARALKDRPCADCGIKYPYYVMDLDHRVGRSSGLVKEMEVVGKIDGISFIYFDERDVVRHKLVQAIVKAYDAYGSGPSAR